MFGFRGGKNINYKKTFFTQWNCSTTTRHFKLQNRVYIRLKHAQYPVVFSSENIEVSLWHANAHVWVWGRDDYTIEVWAEIHKPVQKESLFMVLQTGLRTIRWKSFELPNKERRSELRALTWFLFRCSLKYLLELRHLYFY